jgi:membrane-associated phospholipid phosphatase
MIQAWDLQVILALRSCHQDAAVWAAWLFATIAWKGILFWSLAALLFVIGRRSFALQLALATFIGTIEVGLLKGIVARPRPGSDFTANALPELLSTQHSFPSGHTLVAAAAAFVIAARCPKWAGALVWLFVALVGVARVYQGMHWMTDVFGSIALGAAGGYVAVKLSKLPWLARIGKEQEPIVLLPTSWKAQTDSETRELVKR